MSKAWIVVGYRDYRPEVSQVSGRDVDEAAKNFRYKESCSSFSIVHISEGRLGPNKVEEIDFDRLEKTNG